MLLKMFKPLFKNKKFIIGFSIFAFFVLLGLLGPA
ncbi:MAG TPA: ABC transporter permease, partial [Thermotoga sp.]|nr:ABC transporter permease [Thermotoga sp.]